MFPQKTAFLATCTSKKEKKMKGVEYRGVTSVDGPIIVVKRTENVSYNEIVYVRDKGGEKKTGRVIDLNNDTAIVQIFGSTTGIDLNETTVEFLGEPMELRVGEVFWGASSTDWASQLMDFRPSYHQRKSM